MSARGMGQQGARRTEQQAAPRLAPTSAAVSAPTFMHGGDVFGPEGGPDGNGLLDFSSNINPLGMPLAAQRALVASPADFARYPDPACRALCAALAEKWGVPAQWIVCTAGAGDLISRAVFARAAECTRGPESPHAAKSTCTSKTSGRPLKALVTAPCFSGYEKALYLAGADVRRYLLSADANFDVDAGFAAWVSGRDIVIVCSPNNPTGRVVARTKLEALARAAQAAGALLMVDESFLAFTDEPSCVSLCADFPNLLVVRAFTKFHALAGVRLGYGVCSDENLVDRLNLWGLDWAVSSPAQAAGLAVLSDPHAGRYAQETRQLVGEERAYLTLALEDLGFRVVPSAANYLLFQDCAYDTRQSCEAGPQSDAELSRGNADPSRDLFAKLKEEGVLVRSCADYHGLDASWYRIAVRAHADNVRLVGALRRVLEGGCADVC